MDQIFVDTPATLSASWYVDGTIVDPGVVTVTITKQDGTALYTAASASGTGAAARTKALTTSDTANLDTLTAVWTSPTYGDLVTTVEIVGDLLFTEVQVRAFAANAEQTAPLSDASKYPDAKIAEVRSEIAEQLIDWCGVPFWPRYQRVVLDGTGTQELMLFTDRGNAAIRVSDIRSIEYRDSGQSTWTAYTSTELADVFIRPGGRIYRESLGTFTKGIENIRVGFEHGHSRVPGDIRRAALILARDKLVASNVGDRAISFTNEFGVVERRSVPGAKRTVYTGIPEVDGILMYHDERIPGIG